MQLPRLDERTRRFLREVGSIVLGVLIALLIGEVADSVRHRVNANRALAAMRSEYAVSGVSLEERMLKGRCILRRIETIRDVLAKARITGRLEPIAAIGRPNVRPLTNAAWETFVGSGDMLYASPQTIRDGRTYASLVATYNDLQSQEQLAWAKLRVLENRPDPVGGDLMAELETTVEEARNVGKWLNIVTRQIWMWQQRLGAPTDYAAIDGMSREILIADARNTPLCHPL